MYKIEVFFCIPFTSRGRGGVCINIGVVCYSFFYFYLYLYLYLHLGEDGREGVACFNESSYLFLFICIFLSVKGVIFFFWLAGFGLGCFFFHIIFFFVLLS